MKKLCGVIAVLLACAVASPVSAQETTGAIAGRIVDAQGLPLPGVTVTTTGSQGTKTVVTDGEGRFTVPFLTPGAYAVHAELQGFKAIDRSEVEVRLGATVDLPLTMEIGALAETIEVVAAPPVVDTTRTTVGVHLEAATLSRLPVGRRFSDTLFLAPGVSSGGNVGRANPSIGGSSGLENQYVIDGVNITNGGFGALGSYSIVFGSLGSGTPYDFIQEVQVKTAGYEAEFGQATGGVINVVTKSGSNQFKGSAFVYAQPKSFESAYKTAQSIEGTVNTVASRLSDAGATVGAPVVRDRLFAFAAIDPQWQTTTFRSPEGFPLEALGDVDRDRRITNYAAKATWQATGGHRFDASFFGDPATGASGPQRSSALLNQTTGGYSSLEFGGHNQAVHYNGILNRRFLVEASFGHAVNRIVETPSVDEWLVTDFRVSPSAISGGVGFYEAGNRSNSWQIQAKAATFFSGRGEHQLRYGVDYEYLDFSQLQQYTGPTFTAPNGQRTATGAVVDIIPDATYGQIYHVTRASLTSARPTTQHYTALFVEDAWKIGNSLTIRPGVRYETEMLSGSIVKDFTLKNNWAPRLGIVWDPSRSGKAKVFANYGRYYARVPNVLAARVLSSDATITADYFDKDLTRPVPDGTVTVNATSGAVTTTHFTLLGANAATIDPDAKLSYYNEWVAGTEYALSSGLEVGVRFVHRDIGRVLEDVQPYPILATSLGLPGAASADYLLTNPGPETPVVQSIPGATIAFESPVHDYNAVEVTANKRLANNWSLISSYRWSRLTGNFEGFFRNDNGQSDPAITSLYDYPTSDPTYATLGANMFGYTGNIEYLGSAGIGPLPLDRTHDIKVYGTYHVGRGLNLSLGLELQSGAPLTAFAAHPVYDTGGEIPLTPRGAGFETSDGFLTRTPWTKPVNAGVSYALRMGARSLLLSADVFNVFDTQTTLDYDAFSELQFGVPNPDFGAAGVSATASGQQFTTPRQIRIGIRYEF